MRFFRAGARARRNLFLWSGDVDSARQAMGADRLHEISVVELLSSDRPYGPDSAVEAELVGCLRNRLERITDDLPIVMIRDCGLLARYGRDLASLFGWLTSRRMIVMVCPPLDVSRLGQPPSGMKLEPGQTLNRLLAVVPVGQIVEDM
jgi:hypothetical protein